MMDSLIGDRFLKRIFGNRSHRRHANPAGEMMHTAGNGAEVVESSNLEIEKTIEPVCPPSEDLLNKEAALEINKTGETSPITDAENSSDQPAAD